jgi:hypothetical protein
MGRGRDLPPAPRHMVVDVLRVAGERQRWVAILVLERARSRSVGGEVNGDEFWAFKTAPWWVRAWWRVSGHWRNDGGPWYRRLYRRLTWSPYL